MRTPENCPNCGADLPKNAKACPECGSDEKTGWSEEADYGGLDIPEEKFDYENFVENEFGKKKIVPRGLHWFWWVTAVLIVGSMIYFLFRK